MYDFIEVVSVEEVEETEDTYDITVEENHNFFANGILVHNCLGGVYAGDYWNHRENGSDAVLKAMRETTENMLSIFGDNWYGEVQWNYIKEQHELNQYVIKVCKEYNVEVVSTADAHFPSPERWKDRELYKRLGWKTGDSPIPDTVKELGYNLYPKNGDEMFREYYKTSRELGFEYDDEYVLQTIERTHEIAFSKVEDFIPDNSIRLPDFVVEEGKTADETLKEHVLKRLEEIGKRHDEEYLERTRKELRVIFNRGFSKYFLTKEAVVKESKALQLAGIARGSAAGSLVAYLLNITELNPLKWGTQFERFLRSDATDYPDIDFDTSLPMELKEHLIKKWGENNVVPISTVQKLKPKSLIKGVSKFYGVEYSEVNEVTKEMDKETIRPAKEKHGITTGQYEASYEDYLEFSKTLQNFMGKYPQVGEQIEKLANEPSAIGRHAGGVVIAQDLNRYMPLIASGDVVQTPWSEGQHIRHLEPMGFIKFDILGLKTLRIIEIAISKILKKENLKKVVEFRDIKNFYDNYLHADIIDTNDQKVWKHVFHEGRWAACFQLTEQGAQSFCQQIAPVNLIDLAIITSIYRPGPLGAGVDVKFNEARKDPKKIKYINDLHKQATEETLGFLIFQEQISLLSHLLGEDISLEDGNQLRKVLTKKGTGKEDKVKTELNEKFINGCLNKGMTREQGEELWNNMEFFSGYGFNKSHAVSYAFISFQCAYLFTYHPDEWISAYLEAESVKIDKLTKAVSVAKSLGYKVSAPDINESTNEWTCKNKTLYQPLSSVKGVKGDTPEAIMEHRPFSSIEDIIFNKEIAKKVLGKRQLDPLIKIGALDSLIDERFSGKKHFWACVTANPRNPKKLDELIYDDELRKMCDFEKDEMIENVFSLSGNYPLFEVVTEELINALLDEGIPPFTEYDPDCELHWFVGIKQEIKTTKRGKEYWELTCIDTNFLEKSIKVWSVDSNRDVFHTNKLYLVSKLEYDEKWGYSTGHKAPFYKSYRNVE